jgi:hypothetical protein
VKRDNVDIGKKKFKPDARQTRECACVINYDYRLIITRRDSRSNDNLLYPFRFDVRPFHVAVSLRSVGVRIESILRTFEKSIEDSATQG